MPHLGAEPLTGRDRWDHSTWILGGVAGKRDGIARPRRAASKQDARSSLRWPGCPPRFRREGGAGGFRFRPIGSDEGGLEELVELSQSRAWRSCTVAFNSAISTWSTPRASRRAACASSGAVIQSGSRTGGGRLICSNTNQLYKLLEGVGTATRSLPSMDLELAHPSLDRRCPASAVKWASPPPHAARPVPHGLPVESTRLTARASRVALGFPIQVCRRHHPGGFAAIVARGPANSSLASRAAVPAFPVSLPGRHRR